MEAGGSKGRARRGGAGGAAAGGPPKGGRRDAQGRAPPPAEPGVGQGKGSGAGGASGAAAAAAAREAAAAGGPLKGGGKDAPSDAVAAAREQFRHTSLFWTDLIHLMASKPQALTSVGPMRNYAEHAKMITTELLAAGDDLTEFGEALAKYYEQLAATWNEAQQKVNVKVPDIPNDLEQFEAYKRVWIDMFDNDFTELFDSKRFGDNYGRLVSKELDLARHWNNIMGVVLRSANLPSKKDVDGVYRELHDLKKRVSRLEAENRRLRAAARPGAGLGAGS